MTPHEALNVYAYLDLKSSDGYGLISQNNIPAIELSKCGPQFMRVLLDAGFIEYIARGKRHQVPHRSHRMADRPSAVRVPSGSTSDPFGSDADHQPKRKDQQQIH